MTDKLKDQLDEIASLEDQLHLARLKLRECDAAVRKARGVVAEKIHAWQLDRDQPLSPEQNVRDFIASNQAEKAARVAAMGPRPTGRQRSYIDRVGDYAFSGDANDFARKQHNTGYRRGGVSKTTATHMNAQRARRLPSER